MAKTGQSLVDILKIIRNMLGPLIMKIELFLWGIQLLKDGPLFYQNFLKVNHISIEGISGQTTPQMLIRFRPDVIDLNPKVVIILAGINDIAENTGPSTVKMISDNIISMADLAKINGINVIISSILPAKSFPLEPGHQPTTKDICS